MSRTRRAFRLIQNASHCVFAKTAEHWHAPDWRIHESTASNFDAIAKNLKEFADAVRVNSLDGYVFEMIGDRYSRDIEAVSHATQLALVELSARDPGEERCMDQVIEDPCWRFRFSGISLFVAVFASCYPHSNTRHNPNSNSVLFLMQPEAAFTRAVPKGEVLIPVQVRRRIRAEFELAGQEYDIGITVAPFEAYRFVKPLRLGDPIVRWWEAAQSNPA